jgi:acetaldehyde dehydrogenase (acetylating)
MRFAAKPVFRILVNTPSSLGGVGAVTGLAPSFTLGCGTWGGSSTSDNVTPLHLINIKRVAYSIKDIDEVVQKAPDKMQDKASGTVNVEEIIARVIKTLRESGDI